MKKFKFKKPTIEFSVIESCTMWIVGGPLLGFINFFPERFFKLIMIIEVCLLFGVFVLFRKSLKPIAKAVIITAFGALSALAAYVMYYTDYKGAIKKFCAMLPGKSGDLVDEAIRSIPMLALLLIILFIMLNVNVKSFKEDEALRHNILLSFFYTYWVEILILFGLTVIFADKTLRIRLDGRILHVVIIGTLIIMNTILLCLELKEAREIKMLGNEE